MKAVLNDKLYNPYSESMVINVVIDIACEVLGCDKSKLTPKTSLGDELGAESLDFVEIRYNLESKFGISLPQRSVLDYLAMLAPEIQAVADDGKLTKFGARALRGSLFDYNESVAHEGARPNDVMQGATIYNWARLCLGILECVPDACPDCHHTAAVVSRTGKIACASCGVIIKPMSGDEVMAAATQTWLNS